MSNSPRVFYLTCPHCRERGQLPPDLTGVPALECPMCNGHIRLSQSLITSQPQAPQPTPSAAATAPGRPSPAPSVSAARLPSPATTRPGRNRPLSPPARPSVASDGNEVEPSWWSDTRDWLKTKDGLRITVGIAAVLIVALGLRFSGLFSDGGSEPETIERLVNVKIPEATSEELVIAKSVGNQLLRGSYVVLHQFLAADSIESKLEWVLRPELVKPAMVAHYQQFPLIEEISATDFTPPKQLSVDDVSRGIVVLMSDKPPSGVAQANDAQGFRTIVFFRQTSDGIKLDWESYEQLKTQRLQKFLSNTTAPAQTFRVRLTRSHYFGDQLEPAHTISVQLDDLVPMKEQPYIFFPNSSPVADQIVDNLPWSEHLLGSTRYATVRLAWHSSLQSPGQKKLVLEELLCWELLGVGTDEQDPSKARSLALLD